MRPTVHIRAAPVQVRQGAQQAQAASGGQAGGVPHAHSQAMSQSGETSFVCCRSAVRALSVEHESVTRCVVPASMSALQRAPSASASCQSECCSGAARIELSKTCRAACGLGGRMRSAR